MKTLIILFSFLTGCSAANAAVIHVEWLATLEGTDNLPLKSPVVCYNVERGIDPAGKGIAYYKQFCTLPLALGFDDEVTPGKWCYRIYAVTAPAGVAVNSSPSNIGCADMPAPSLQTPKPTTVIVTLKP